MEKDLEERVRELEESYDNFLKQYNSDIKKIGKIFLIQQKDLDSSSKLGEVIVKTLEKFDTIHSLTSQNITEINKNAWLLIENNQQQKIFNANITEITNTHSKIIKEIKRIDNAKVHKLQKICIMQFIAFVIVVILLK